MHTGERVPIPHQPHRSAWSDGTVVGGYQLSYLASGGMSTVYRGQKEGQTFVLKEVPSSSSTLVMALTQEKRLLERLNHPGIVDFVGLFEESGFYYLVMESIEAVPLNRYLANGPLDETQVRDRGVQLCDVFEHLHNQEPPVIYRDLKPENILLQGNTIRLIDFGIARLHKGEKMADTESLGTVTTASPEHYGGSETDERSDIYTLGATLYDFLSGGRRAPAGPFHFAPITSLNPSVSSPMEELLARATSFHPEDRFQSMAEFRLALQGQAPGRRRPWGKMILVALILVVALGGWGLSNALPDPPQEDTGFVGPIFTHFSQEDSATVALGEEVGLLELEDGFGLTAEERAKEISERLNTLYHQRCTACGQMKLEPEGFRVGKVVTGDQTTTVVFYAHIDHGNYFEQPLLLTTLSQKQAERMGTTVKFASLYWRDIIRDLVQLSRGRPSHGPVWPLLGPEFLAARDSMASEEELNANNLRLILQQLQSQKALSLKNLLKRVPPEFQSEVDTFPPIKVRVYRATETKVEFHPLAG